LYDASEIMLVKNKSQVTRISGNITYHTKQ